LIEVKQDLHIPAINWKVKTGYNIMKEEVKNIKNCNGSQLTYILQLYFVLFLPFSTTHPMKAQCI